MATLQATRETDIEPGMRFGHLLALRGRIINRMEVWSCWCDCGSLEWVQARQLRGGNRRSCGCQTRKGNRKCRMCGSDQHKTSECLWVVGL